VAPPAALPPEPPDLPAAPAAEPAAAPSPDVSSSDPPGGGDRQTGGGAGAGGDGSGLGDGALDLSARARPIEPNTSQTLMSTAEAQRDRVSGYVHLVLTVDPLGHVGRVAVRQGLGHGLDEIATRHALQIRFYPARDRAGNPTVGTVRWRFYFEPQ
jgi:TonB family protein